jgi:hypothetical protein
MDVLNSIAVRHVCTLQDVVVISDELLLRQGIKWGDKHIEYLHLYGGLRDLGISHSHIGANFNLVVGTKQVLELAKKPDPWAELPEARLIRED